MKIDMEENEDAIVIAIILAAVLALGTLVVALRAGIIAALEVTVIYLALIAVLIAACYSGFLFILRRISILSAWRILVPMVLTTALVILQAVLLMGYIGPWVYIHTGTEITKAAMPELAVHSTFGSLLLAITMFYALFKTKQEVMEQMKQRVEPVTVLVDTNPLGGENN